MVLEGCAVCIPPFRVSVVFSCTTEHCPRCIAMHGEFEFVSCSSGSTAVKLNPRTDQSITEVTLTKMQNIYSTASRLVFVLHLRYSLSVVRALRQSSPNGSSTHSHSPWRGGHSSQLVQAPRLRTWYRTLEFPSDRRILLCRAYSDETGPTELERQRERKPLDRVWLSTCPSRFGS